MQCTFMSVGTGGSASFKFPCQAPPPTPRPSAGPSAGLETLAHQGLTIREARPHATPTGRAAAVSGLPPRPSTCAGEVLLRQQSLRTPASARPLLSRSAAVLLLRGNQRRLSAIMLAVLNAAQYVCRRGGAAVTAHISCGLRSPAAMLRRPVHCHLAGSLMTQNSGALASSHCLKVQQDAHASACLLQLPAAGVRALAGSLINQGRCRDSIPAGAAPARWLPKVASSHMRLALSLQCCSAAHVRHKVPPHQQTLLTLVNAATREALATQSWLRGHIQQKPTLYHSAFSLCCRRSYSTGSHAGLQQAAAAAAAMKVSVRRGTCVSPGRARVQRLPDPGQPPELALSARAVTSPQGQVCRPAQHGPACHMSAMFCAAC